ncbi:uncharacterized protein LOC144654068 [Oculina patagonica]
MTYINLFLSKVLAKSSNITTTSYINGAVLMILIQFIVDRAILYPSPEKLKPSFEHFAYISTMKTTLILILFSLACVFAGPYKLNPEIPENPCETCDGTCQDVYCAENPCDEGFVCDSCSCFCSEPRCIKKH